MTTPQLAKLTPPRLTKVYNRTRLFKQLDAARDKPVIWISALAGSGKTTLVASYLKERKIKPRWYQVDEGDADIASFFYYLGLLGKQAAPRKKKDLPLLTPEYLLGLPAFTRNFFRELFSRIKAPGVLVLDNFQDAGEKVVLHQILPVALAEVPEGISVIIISRSGAPTSLAPLHASEKVERMGWGALKLTEDETDGIVALRRSVRDQSTGDTGVATLHEQTQGWVTGLVLLIEQIDDRYYPAETSAQSNHSALFEYFAGALFDQTDIETQKFLMQTALLPKFSVAMATSLTDIERVNQILEGLTKRNYFTYKHVLEVPMHEYHPLFRAFLLQRGADKYSAESWRQKQNLAANLLSETGEYEQAAELLQKSGNWPALAELVVTQAHPLIQQGRFVTLAGLIKGLPGEIVENTPWLLYWHGVSQQPYDFRSSRQLYENAYHKFKSSGDVAGLFLAWSGVVDTYINEWGNCIPLDYWIAEMDGLLQEHNEFPSPEIEARVVVGMFTALMFRQPERLELPDWAGRARLLMEQTSDIPLKMAVGSYLALYYMWWENKMSKSIYILNLLETYANAESVSPLTRITWCYIKTAHCWLKVENEESVAAMNEGLQIANESGVHILDCFLIGQGTWPLLTDGNLKAAQSLLDKMIKLVDPARLIDAGQYHFLRFTEALHKNDLGQMKEHAESALRMTREAGSRWAEGLMLSALARAHIEAEEYTEARSLLDQAKKIGAETKVEIIINDAIITELALAYRQGDEKILDVLKSILSRSIVRGFSNVDTWRNEDWANYCRLALENHIEEEFVFELIQKHGMLPPPNQPIPPNWPFPIKITTLGTFKLALDDKPVVFKGKAQRKPIELLKVLIAYGGKDINAQHLAESLWPDAEGDAAYQSFTMTLKRLRELIGKKEALVLIDGKLSLDPQYAWVDVWAMAQGVKQDDPKRLQQALGLYQGAFLEGDDGSWAISPREQWRSKFIKIATRLGEAWQKEQQWQAAIAVYQRGLEIDPLAEDFYQGLMRCYDKLDKKAEAVKVYKQCEALFQSQLGVGPSSSTTRLYDRLSG